MTTNATSPLLAATLLACACAPDDRGDTSALTIGATESTAQSSESTAADSEATGNGDGDGDSTETATESSTGPKLDVVGEFDMGGPMPPSCTVADGELD